MADLSHIWGRDLSLGPTRDLAIVSGAELCTQRLLRRLLTSRIGDVWHPEYGAGLPEFVGEPVHADTIRAIVIDQCRQEADVVQDPPPVVTVRDGGLGNLFLRVRYTYAPEGAAQDFSFGLGG